MKTKDGLPGTHLRDIPLGGYHRGSPIIFTDNHEEKRTAWEMTIGEFVYNDLSSLKIAIKDKTTRIPQTYDPNCPDVIYDYTGNKCSFKEVLLEQTFHMSFPCSNPEKAKEQIKDSVKDGLVKIVFREQEKGTTNILLYVRDIGILDGKVHVMCVSPCIEKETCAADLLP